jgi:hypothetical protein
MLAPEAGYENEEAGNAAFDPDEYLDVLIATGHRSYLMEGRDGNLTYYEMFPEQPMTDAKHEATYAVRWKYCKASTALSRVKNECIRRGLIERG